MLKEFKSSILNSSVLASVHYIDIWRVSERTNNVIISTKSPGASIV